MGYRIVYADEPGLRGKLNGLRLKTMTALAFLIFCAAAELLWPEGSEVLRDVLTGGASSVAEEAFLSFVENCRMGVPAGEAITTFCRAVLEHGS